jgi:hypothetical protein
MTYNQFWIGMDTKLACDVIGCPYRYGLGDHDHPVVEYVTYGPCRLCMRETDSASVNVAWPDGTVGPVCAICWEKRDEDYLDERLDMTDA